MVRTLSACLRRVAVRLYPMDCDRQLDVTVFIRPWLSSDRGRLRSRSCRPGVPMMKTADARLGPRLAWFGRAWLNRPARRRRLLQADVRAVFLVIGDIFTSQSPTDSPKPAGTPPVTSDLSISKIEGEEAEVGRVDFQVGSGSARSCGRSQNRVGFQAGLGCGTNRPNAYRSTPRTGEV